MTQAQRAWDSIEPAWRSSFELAWESFVAGSVPVGAVVTDANGIIVARGRARSMVGAAAPGQLANATVAHAEINALGQVPVGPHVGYAIYTTLEPCVMCMGAIVVANIGIVRYAGADALWAGLERLSELNAFIAGRWPRRVGPWKDELGAFAALLPLLFYVERYPSGATAASHAEVVPELLELARGLAASGEHRRWTALSVTDALEALWPRLAPLARHRDR